MACSAKPDEICGGLWRNSVYDIKPDPPQNITPDYLGCYEDKIDRDLIQYYGDHRT